MRFSIKHAALAAAVAASLFAAGTVAASSVVAEWNEEMLAAVRANAPRPTVVSRSMFLVHSAIYDAWAAYDAVALASVPANRSLRRPAGEHTEANRHMAVSFAARRVLAHEWPTEVERFDDFLASLGYSPSDSMDATTPDGLGNRVAQAVLDARADDGSNYAANYADTVTAHFPMVYLPHNSADPNDSNAAGQPHFNPSRWQPLRVPTGALTDGNGNPVIDHEDPATYSDQKFLTPHWGDVRSFAAGDPHGYLPPRPPQHGSDAPYVDALGQSMSNHEAWNRQFDQVLEFSANLTDEHKVIAEFWADGPRSETPPGHWNQLAQGVSVRDDHDIGTDARMFFALNAAVFDAGIVTWYTKRVYDFIRPAAAIRHKYAGQTIMAWGGPDQGTQEIAGEDWLPYQALTFVTPPFAEFTSGHSGFSAASAAILTELTGSETFYDGVTRIGKDLNGDGEEDLLGQHIAMPGSNMFEGSPVDEVVLRWETFKEAADEAGISRLYGGIHVQDGDLHGRIIGERVAEAVLARSKALFAGRRPVESGLSGTWFNPGRDGEGFTIDVLEDGRVVVAWLTYDSAGLQTWLTGVGEVGDTGEVEVELQITQGPSFGSGYDSADLDRTVWGTARLGFTACDRGSVSWTPVAPGFEPGSLELVRLTGVAGRNCNE